MTGVSKVDGSFRDPGGYIYLKNNRIYRTVTNVAVADFDFVEKSGLIKSLEKKKYLVVSKKVPIKTLGPVSRNLKYVLEHEKIPFVSYPYEWPPVLLKKAALLQLDILLEAINYGVTLSDSSAYNIQFFGTHPVFIDRLSFIPYQEGSIWQGYKQFCEQFLFPLMLTSYCGIPFQDFYRGNMEGVPLSVIKRAIPFLKTLKAGVFKHVTLQDKMQKRAAALSNAKDVKSLKEFKLGRNLYIANLASMRKLIAGLDVRGAEVTLWENYSTTHSYDNEEEKNKKAFVKNFCRAVKPEIVWDLGCNTGAYAKAALAAGAGYAVGFDGDIGALNFASSEKDKSSRGFLPLYMNLTNVSPSQGWRQKERDGLQERSNADAILALALVHHMTIAGNIPLDQLVDWLTGLAPDGVIEFVPKNDPMVEQLLLLRKDIFPDYEPAHFEARLKQRATIIRAEIISKSGRVLYWYKR